MCVQKSCKGYRFLPYTVDASNGLVSVVSEREHPSVAAAAGGSLGLSLSVPPSAGGGGGFGTSSAVASLLYEQPLSLVSSLAPASAATPDRKDSTASIASLAAAGTAGAASGPAALYLRHRLKLHFSEVQVRQKYALFYKCLACTSTAVFVCACRCVASRRQKQKQK